LSNYPNQIEYSNSLPFLYRLAKSIQRTGLRGGYNLENSIRKIGWLDKNYRFNFPNNTAIDIPIAKRSYDTFDIMQYESSSIDQVKIIVEKYNDDFCLFDCGADIGLMSAKLVSALPSIKHVYAFEPNKTSFDYLKNNIKLINANGHALNKGVSDFSGRAELQFPEFDSHDHAAYIVPKEDGDFDVTTIDIVSSNFESSSLIIKIDVEGAELAFVKGAKDSIRKAKNVVILFEAHPSQVQRSGIDPVEIINYINKLRKCRTVVMEEPNIVVDIDQPFFEQLANDKVFNICVYSK